MANQIALDLLKQAKQYLVEGKYAEAVKASTGVIALDEGNSEAKDILTAAEAASEVSNKEVDTSAPVAEPATIEPPRVRDSSTDSKVESLNLQIKIAKTAQDCSNVEARIQELVDQFPGDTEIATLLESIRETRLSFGFSNLEPNINAYPSSNLDRPTSPKSFWITLLFCLLVGTLGGHRFYVGKMGSGIWMFITLGGFGLWTIVDFLMIAIDKFADDNGRPIVR